MTTERAEQVAEALAGTCRSGIELAEELGMEIDEVENLAANGGIERCGCCDWWCEISELNDDGFCEDCRGAG
ncbi:MAG: hypothetical protein WC992_03100 [Acholeplasmataceae bacterium]|jgi:hypothetical protein